MPEHNLFWFFPELRFAASRLSADSQYGKHALLRNQMSRYGDGAPTVVARGPQGCSRTRISIDTSLLCHPTESALIHSGREEDCVLQSSKRISKVEIVLCDSRRKSSTKC
jgi:hypothetical protein